MDVVSTGNLVNVFLGCVYFFVFSCISFLVWSIKNSSTPEYSLIMSKKSFLLSFFFMVAVTCATVSYQNFFSNFTKELLWWRLGLISTIGYISFRWSVFAWKIKKTVNYDR